MDRLPQLFEGNRKWAERNLTIDPEFFVQSAIRQKPKYLWIGCSDSRVPANEVVGLPPGELFVHRNIANLVPHTDVNCLSVLEYAVAHLQVEHVIVCGHYGCGGVEAAMDPTPHGLVDNWLRNIRDVAATSYKELAPLPEEERKNRLVELNVRQQALNVCYTTIVQKAWSLKQPVTVHGWVYNLKTGLIKDLECSVNRSEQIHEAYLFAER
jgi:carbonic anhydrase